LRPLSLSELLDRTFSLYRKNFVLFAGIGALPPALVLVGQLLIFVMGFSLDKTDPFKSPATIAALLLAGSGFIVLGAVGYALATGASVFAVSRVHLGYQTTIVEAYKLMMPRVWPILGIVILAGLAVGIPLVILVAAIAVPAIMAGVGKPGGPSPEWIAGLVIVGLLVLIVIFAGAVFLSTKFSLAVASCVLEGRGVIESLRRSWSLTEGTFWRLILVLLLASAISSALSLVLSIPYMIGMVLVVTRKDASAITPFVAWQYFAGFLSKTLAGPIATIAVCLVYYDQRVRKEAFDLQVMMDNLGPAAPAQAPPPTMG
jgi:hypothetical protein